MLAEQHESGEGINTARVVSTEEKAGLFKLMGSVGIRTNRSQLAVIDFSLEIRIFLTIRKMRFQDSLPIGVTIAKPPTSFKMQLDQVRKADR